MAKHMYFDCRKVLMLSVILFLFISVCFSAFSEPQLESTWSSSRGSRRRMLEAKNEEQATLLKKKTTSDINTSQSTKNQTKLIKPNSLSSKNQTKTMKSDNISTKNQTKTIKSKNISTKNQTKTIKSNNISTKNQTKAIKSNDHSSKNQTKLVKVSSNSSSKTTPTDTGLKKLNSTTYTSKIKKVNSTSKASTNSSKPSSVSISSKKSLDLVKASNKTAKATATTKDKDKDKQTKTTKVDQIEPEKPNKKQKASPNQQQQQQPSKKASMKQAPPRWIFDEEEDDDLVSEFKDLPNKFHQTLIPDLERISTTSRAYITKANKEMTQGFKPYVGKKYAPTIATVISCAFILIPLLLVSLLCNRIKAYFPLQKVLIFIQIYLSIYFSILCISSLVIGLETLKFLFSTSQSTYLCLQVLQTLAYVFYLLLLLMYLILVFSTKCGLGSKFLGLAQTFVGFSVGLHYYATVFHRLVLRQPPKTNWKIHGIYATCFLLICLLSRAYRRKKAYVEDGGGEGKQN